MLLRDRDPRGAAGELALHLANTVAGPDPERSSDALDSPAHLARWLEAERDRIGPAGQETPLRVQDFRALREAVREAFLAAVRGEALPVGAVRKLNDASASVPWYVRLDASDPAVPRVSVEGTAGSRTAVILATIAGSAIEILGGEDRARLRVCRAPGCGRFFLPPRSGQVWCSPACGNRARVARHYARARAR